MTRLMESNPEPEYVDDAFPASSEAPDPWDEPAAPPAQAAKDQPEPNLALDDEDEDEIENEPPAVIPAPDKAPEPAAHKRPTFAGTPYPIRAPSPRADADHQKPAPARRLPQPRPIKFTPAPPPPAGKTEDALPPAGGSGRNAIPPGISKTPRPAAGLNPPRIGIKPSEPQTPAPPARPPQTLAWDLKPAVPASPAPPRGSAPQLAALIASHQPLPANAIILGADPAGKPLLLDFADPSVGAMLILGEGVRNNRAHLNAIIASAARLSPPDTLHLDTISPLGAGFAADTPHIRQRCQPEDECVFDLLGEYLSLVETRSLGAKPHPTRLLILDEVDRLTDRLAAESLSFLRWILRRGPEVNVWAIASLAAGKADQFDRKTFHAFGLRLYGSITNLRLANRYTPIPPHTLKNLSPGAQACLKLGEEIIEFAIPTI
jgi:hypothetical protein